MIIWKDPTEVKRKEWNNLVGYVARHKTYKGLNCPSCSANKIYYFFIRFSNYDNRGGGWIWCSNCYTYEHFSSKVPDWWENIETAPLEKLDIPPNWLNKI